MVSDGCLLEQTGRTETERERHQQQLAHRWMSSSSMRLLHCVTGTQQLAQRDGGKVQSRRCSLGWRLELRWLLKLQLVLMTFDFSKVSFDIPQSVILLPWKCFVILVLWKCFVLLSFNCKSYPPSMLKQFWRLSTTISQCLSIVNPPWWNNFWGCLQLYYNQSRTFIT